MSSRTKKIPAIAAAVCVVLGVVWHLIGNISSVPAVSDYPFNLNRIRGLARSGGKGPVELRTIIVAQGAFPEKAVVAGRSILSKTPMVFTSFQVVYNRRSVIIDTAHDKSLHEEFFSGNPFFQDKFDAMQKGLRKASMILITHEHIDHAGGIAHSPHLEEITSRVFMTREQINGPTIVDTRFPAGSLGKFKPLIYERYHRVAPGMVLIKAPGHSTGSQMIYLRMENGTEFLFVGDIAWNMDNITSLTGRPWITSKVFLGEDRRAVAHQLRTLYNLQIKKELNIIVAHDKPTLETYIKSGKIKVGFK